MRAPDIAGLILDPKVAGEAQRSGKRWLTRHRGHAEAAPVDPLQRRVELADQVGPRRIRQFFRPRKSVRGEPSSVAQERVQRIAEVKTSRVRRRDEHVIDVAARPRVGAGKWKRAGRINHRPATMADE